MNETRAEGDSVGKEKGSLEQPVQSWQRQLNNEQKKQAEVLSKTKIETEVRRQVKNVQSDSMTTGYIILFLKLLVMVDHANEGFCTFGGYSITMLLNYIVFMQLWKH